MKEIISVWGFPLAVLVVVMVMAVLWQLTPLQRFADPEFIDRLIETVRGGWWTPVAILATYVLASVIIFPNSVINVTVILAFGGLLGWPFAMGGSLTAATVFFFLGHKFGGDKVRRIESRRLEKLRRVLRHGGIKAVLAVRLMPIAPFPVINLAAGSLHIKYSDFLIGTGAALLPGTLTMAIFGEQLENVLKNPSAANISALVVIGIMGVFVLWSFRRYILDRIEKEERAETKPQNGGE
ncbi:MAG: VTT domain-containing protein [Deltaproteobacteria bacterium]|nr:VTT domain-containing protein [Deltaproteobacteria bacterium]